MATTGFKKRKSSTWPTRTEDKEGGSTVTPKGGGAGSFTASGLTIGASQVTSNGEREVSPANSRVTGTERMAPKSRPGRFSCRAAGKTHKHRGCFGGASIQ